MRLAVYTDYVYRLTGGVIHAERAFALFLAALAPQVQQLKLIGRLAPASDATRYALPSEIELAPLGHYASLTNPVAVLRSLVGSVGSMVRALDDIDVVWVLGPYPHAYLLVLVALARRRTVVLGVRQDWPSYVRTRHPGRRWLHLAAELMEWTWRTIARWLPVVAVGPDLSSRYGHAPAVLDLTVSLVPGAAVLETTPSRDYDSELRVFSVGRLDEEKNPLLLADILAQLHAHDPRWRLIVCGEGDLAPALAARLAELGLADRAAMLGYVAMGPELLELYRTSHALLHVSWTEGFPQVLIEAFASGLPVVATAVGGVTKGVGDAALLIAPGDPEPATEALLTIAQDSELRNRLSAAGLRLARELTLEAQTARLVAFLAAASPPARARARRSAP
jgi:glycosyltransferase involved in cell wall biosynthesis